VAEGCPSRKLKFSFKVERQEVRRRALPAQEPDWSPADYAKYLKPTSLGPTGGEVKKLSDTITKGKKTVLKKAKAIYGWVPVDLADVRKKMLVEKIDLKDDRTNAYRDSFWGGIDPDRVVIAHGRDNVLNPPQKGAPLIRSATPMQKWVAVPLISMVRPRLFTESPIVKNKKVIRKRNQTKK
jgi:hypothetical protein